MQGQGQAKSVDLVALPESIFPVPMQHVPPSYLQTFRDFAQQRKTAVIFGVFLEEPRGNYFNSAVAYGSNERRTTRPCVATASVIWCRSVSSFRPASDGSSI